MTIFDNMNTRGIYLLEDSGVCFDGYIFFTSHFIVSENYYKPTKMLKHIKRAVPKRKKIKNILKQSKIVK